LRHAPIYMPPSPDFPLPSVLDELERAAAQQSTSPAPR
jgi:hypothetical protein